jgi:alpha-maltose-1-phosphate synthase
MGLLFSHPTGNANVRYAALGLQRAGLLEEFWTCINYRGGAWSRVLPGGVRAQLSRRTFAEELQPHMRVHPFRELGRLVAHKVGLGKLARHEHGVLSVDAVYRSLDERTARRLRENPRLTGVYAYEDGAAATFREARSRGLATLYDLPIGYWRAARDILIEEGERHPEWASTLIGNEDSEAKTARKDEELALADAIFVASSYTLKTLQHASHVTAPVWVIPYGAPIRTGPAPVRKPRAKGGPLRVIFVGSLGQRKGLSYLFDAIRLCGSGVELTVIGTKPLQPCPRLDEELKKVRWIPSCPHSQVLAEMAAHDVFVFPSLFEGFGLVLLEAMAVGLPIITTPNTAGPDLIKDGQEGYIVPIRSAETIAQKLLSLRADPELAVAMGQRAMQTARTFTWENYGQRLSEKVREACQPELAKS